MSFNNQRSETFNTASLKRKSLRHSQKVLPSILVFDSVCCPFIAKSKYYSKTN